MRYVILVFLLLLTLVLPGTLFHLWAWSGIKPDLAMLFIIYVALHEPKWTGILWGLGTGLIEDFYLGHYLGMYSVTLTLVAALTSWLAGRWYRENFSLTMLLVFLVTAVGQLMVGFLGLGAGLSWSASDIFRLVLGVSIYNALLVPVTYPWIHRSFLHGWLRYRPKYER
ncbi:MAG: rod shape-determining protein MreD [Desulfitobacteriaceae bacterium]|nr:rod shape-determining protein MreD [Desulfitobacteriaceae bacterium]MDI6878689.1 rod shape-determining protein MreD [Desulfitobacteriaceae bacterium]MDI6914128.1 rod shape-determining protein MreD [Desulfitobacteriaceae bacterium]